MTVRFETVDVDGLKVFYRSAGDPSAPVVVVVHGFPTASHMFRDLIPELADEYRVVAPDLPGFGMTEQPTRDVFDYTFDNITMVISRFTKVLGLKQFAIYVFDYGAPGACCKRLDGLQMGFGGSQFYALLTSESPKQNPSSRFCSWIVQ